MGECHRDVAQFGRALRSGRRGRRFKSCHPDHFSSTACISGCSAVGSARVWGARCRRFKSCHSDQIQKPHKHLQIKCLCGFSSFSHPVKLRSKRLKKATPSCQKVVSLTRHVLSKTAPFFSPANKH